VTECDLIANAYSEGLTLAEGLAFVEFGDASRKEKYKQFFLLVFDFASPAYGSTAFNATFNLLHQDLAPGTLAYFIAPIGSLKFTDKHWSLDLLNYLDHPANEPGGTTWAGERVMSKFYPRLRFYRAVAHEANSDPFYGLANAQRETERLNLQVAQREQAIEQRERAIEQREGDLKEATRTALVAQIAAPAFAVLMVLVTWRWWAIKGRFRRMTEEYQKKLKSLLTSAVCIPDAPNTDQASEST
jgi:hypothetical protein